MIPNNNNRMKMPKCFIDFDGTIVDNKYRLYAFFQDNIDKNYANLLELDEFWNLKRMKISEIDWMNKIYNTNVSNAEWNKLKVDTIESDYYLQYDVLFPFSKRALEILHKYYYVVLISKRERHNGLLNQINGYQIGKYFDDIIIVPHSDISKDEAILDKYKVYTNDVIIGDTEDDISAGIKLGINMYFVQSGIRSTWVYKNLREPRNVTIIQNLLEVALEICRVM